VYNTMSETKPLNYNHIYKFSLQFKDYNCSYWNMIIIFKMKKLSIFITFLAVKYGDISVK